MKILFLSDDFPPQSFGGAGISTFELAAGMRKAGHEVFVVTTCRNESEAGESEYRGLKVFKIASNYRERWRAYVSVYNPAAVREVKKILARVRPDIVHAHNVHFYLSFYCLKLAKRYAKAVVFTARDTMTICYGKLGTERYLKHFDPRVFLLDDIRLAKKRWNPLRNFFIKRYLNYTDKVFAISNSLKQALQSNGIENVEVIYNGIDASQWQVDADAAERFKAKHKLDGKKILLFGGRLSEAKGGAKVIEALARIVKEMPDTVLLVAGTVDLYARAMQEQAKTMGIAEHLVFTGWIERDEIKTAYAVSDVVLMPSIYLDPFGRVNIEAMAAKKPVVGTCYGGTPEIVIEGVTGYIVNPLHPEEIAQKALELLGNPAKAEQFGAAGYERVKAGFSLEDKVREYLLCYHSLL